jgi:hypothetical protein
MKPSTGTVALGLGLALSLAAPYPAAFATDPAELVLLGRADYWRGQHRLDLVADTLQKVLALNSRQPDALYQIGLLAAEQGNAIEAQRYFERLQQIAPDNPRAAELVKNLPSADARVPAVTPTATAPVALATADQPRKPAPLMVASADSDDLVATRPPASFPPRVPATASSNGIAAQRLQLASLPDATSSDVEPATPNASIAAAQVKPSDLGPGAKAIQMAQVELMPPPPVGGYQRPVVPYSYSADDSLEAQLDRNLAQVEAQTNPMLIAGVGLRDHGGSNGLDRLTEVGGSFEGSFSPWLTGTARFAVLPVWVYAGSVGSENLGQFGANPILAALGSPLAASGSQSATGVGLLGSYSYQDFSGQFGTSPLGFPVTNLVGTVAYAPKFWDNTLTLRFEGLRQPVIDSVLSYAGTHASLGAANAATNGAFGTNSTWGGVVRTGGRFTAFYDNNFYGAYGGAGIASLTGTNVAQNNALDALAGTYFRPWKTDDWAIRVGVALYYASFNKNLDGFTFGQGGYFSPQNYESLTFPVEYTGHSGNWSWLAALALGVQHFNTDSTPVFPNNPFAQTILASTPGALTTFSGTSSTGLAINAKGQIEYAIDNSLVLGASASIDNSNSYTEGIGKVYLRKTFDWFGPSLSGTDPQSIVARDQPQSHL